MLTTQEIMAIIPHRYPFLLIDRILELEPGKRAVGEKLVTIGEPFFQGHFPDYPLMPGVLMCEAAAQLVSFYVIEQKLMESDFLGFGGMENVRFRAPVRPGNRLMLVGKLIRYHRRQTIFNVQAFVGDTMVFEGDIIGVPLQKKDS